jgi:hypothetical protein
VVAGFHPAVVASDEALAAIDRESAAASALATQLESDRVAHRPWGAVWSLLFAFFTLGLVPALLWHDRFRDFVGEERQRLRRFADWMRLRSSRPETMDLRVAADDLSVRPLLSMLSFACVLGVILFFAVDLNTYGPTDSNPIHRVVSVTYSYRPPPLPWRPPLTQSQRLFGAWGIGLTIAYLFHWLQVQAHAGDVRRIARSANSIFRAEGVPRVPLPRVGVRLSLLWIAAAAFLTTKGAWWGIAMALSGAAQQYYMNGESLRLRRALAARVREMARLPVVSEEGTISVRSPSPRRCPHVRCLAIVPDIARFCPRCGHNLSARTMTTMPAYATRDAESI